MGVEFLKTGVIKATVIEDDGNESFSLYNEYTDEDNNVYSGGVLKTSELVEY